MRTHVEDASHTHYFGSEGSVDEKGANESTVDIIDLTTKSFRKIVRKPGTVSVFFIKLIRSFLRIDTSTLTSVLVIEHVVLPQSSSLLLNQWRAKKDIKRPQHALRFHKKYNFCHA